ncbi:MAG: hypothetical protein JETCAE02_16700 [Anaerolineaceae bacterium]|nr:MAG: hypothetical protein QY324_12800 [Anaerolineales bacterium]GIK08936.1 MAG: hypothetical protein BroJett001_10020 [Chloroflexota bacterium]GJQ39258.1 MAG: hypothetical protein JETCAE02_16700 [Anaerolineaceae bacterium]HMM99311.1 hypothetical protein [Anaerolineales bacterium]
MNPRDIEQLSEFLDGRLKPSASARLESRLASEPELVSALDGMRESRALLRRMPKRRAPRNFTLTPKMVGLKPPLPRAYPILRFATVAAAFLFAVSFVRIGSGALGAAQPAAEPAAFSAEALTDEAPLLAAAPAPGEELATPAPDAASAEASRSVEQPPAAKSAGEPAPAPPLLTNLQIAFAAIALVGAVAMLLFRRLAARKWLEK